MWKIQLKGMKNGKFSILNGVRNHDKGKDVALPLTEANYSKADMQDMKERCTYIAIYLKSSAEAQDALDFIKKHFPKFEGKPSNKATSNGNWFVGQGLADPVSDRTYVDACFASK
jgi:hypothetical protein